MRCLLFAFGWEGGLISASAPTSVPGRLLLRVAYARCADVRQDTGESVPTGGTAMDFDEAIAIHSKWKRKLRQYLANHDRSLNPAEVGHDDRCTLGKWIYSEGAAYSAMPEYVKLRFEHARFHAIAAELVRKANAGQAMSSHLDPCAGSEFSKASSAIVRALTEMKKRVSESRARSRAHA